MAEIVLATQTTPANPAAGNVGVFVDSADGYLKQLDSAGNVLKNVSGLPLGLTGATQTTRYVGATTTGAPASGTFAKGDFVVSQDGNVWVCTVAGTPGTWVDSGSVGNLVTSVFGRTGVVAATSGDYTAAQVTNAADKSSGSTQTFTSAVAAPDFAPSGLTGATAASRYVGATASGAPASGTFAVGDVIVDQTGKLFVCTVAGTPGTWVAVGGTSANAPPSGGGFGYPASVPLATGSTNAFASLIYVSTAYTTTSVGWQCAVSSGNLQLALYDAGGTRRAVKTSFASPGTGQRSAAWGASFAMVEGWYYMVVQVDNGTIQLGAGNNNPQGLGWTFANTYASGLPASLPALSSSQTMVSLALLA